MRKGLRTKIRNTIHQGLWVDSGPFGTQNRCLVGGDAGLELGREE